MFDLYFQNHFHDISSLTHVVRASSYVGIFLLSICISYIIPLPEVILLILFGYVAKTANLNLVLVILLSAMGSIVGNNIVYRLSFFRQQICRAFQSENAQKQAHPIRASGD